MSIPTVYKLDDHYKGDTFDGIEFEFFNPVDDNPDNDTPIDITVCTAIKIQFRKNSPTGDVVKELNISSGLSIIPLNTLKVLPFIIDWDEGKYYYDSEFTFSPTVKKTYVKGTINIIQDVTNG